MQTLSVSETGKIEIKRLVSVPTLNLKNAIRLYYNNIELSNKDIKEMFAETLGTYRIQALKRVAREKSIENSTLIWDARKVNTKDAFKAWGLDIEDLERRLTKLTKHNLI